MKLYFSGQERFAEPDVVITFEHITLIVEVKPPAGGMQYQQQWRKELYTYLHDDDAKILSIFSLWAICLEQQQTGLLN